MPFNIEASDFVTIGLLVVLEAILSADNALVLAVLVLPLPKKQQKRALQYGIFGAFAFRIIATIFAVHLIAWTWIKLIGGLYLLYLPVKHFTAHPNESRKGQAAATAILGLSIFWSTVVRVELTDIVFAIDSVPAALAISPSRFVVYSSNALAVLGLRSLFVLLERLISQLKYLHYGLAAVLLFSAAKLATARWIELSPVASISIIIACIGATIWPSVRALRRLRREARDLPPALRDARTAT